MTRMSIRSSSTRALVIAVALLFTAAGCTSTGSGQLPAKSTSAKKILKVGITANAPPLIYKHNGQISGLEAELARKLAERTGKKVQFVEVAWKDQIPALVDGRTDIIMSGMTVTELRKYRINFADPYLVSGQVSLVRRDEFKRFNNGLPDLVNITIKIGTVAATTGSYLVQQKLAGNEVKEFSTPQKAIAALINKKIDAFVYDLPMNLYFGAMHEANGLVPVPTPLSREHLAWGIRKENPDLLAAANALLEELKQSGQLQEMTQRWIPFYKNFYNQ